MLSCSTNGVARRLENPATGHRVAKYQEVSDLECQQWQYRDRRNAWLPGQCIAETEAKKAAEEAEILVKGEHFPFRAVPSDDRQLEEEARSGRDDDRERDARSGQLVQKSRLGLAKGLEYAVEPSDLRTDPERGGQSSRPRAAIGTQNAATTRPPPSTQVEAAATKGSTRASASDIRTKRTKGDISRDHSWVKGAIGQDKAV